MQAITTKYLSPGNVRGARIKATCERGSITIDYPHELTGWRCHEAAAKALVAKFLKEDERGDRYSTPPGENPWGRPMVCGGMNGSGYAFCWPEIDSNQVVVQFTNHDDMTEFLKFQKLCSGQEGTPGAMYCGIAAAILRRSTI